MFKNINKSFLETEAQVENKANKGNKVTAINSCAVFVLLENLEKIQNL